MKFVFLDSGYKSYQFEKELFEGNGFELRIYPTYDGEKTDKMDFAKNADGILVRHTRIDEEFLSKMKNLKALVRYGIGYDNIDVNACTRFGVKVANVQGICKPCGFRPRTGTNIFMFACTVEYKKTNYRKICNPAG